MHSFLLGLFILKEIVNVCVCDSVSGKRNLKQKEFGKIMQNNCPYGLVNEIGHLKVILAFSAVQQANAFFMSFPAEMDNKGAGSEVQNFLNLWCFLVYPDI